MYHLYLVLLGFGSIPDAYNTNMKLTNKKGDTCLSLAMQSGKEEMIMVLISCEGGVIEGEDMEIMPLLVQAITTG